MRPDGGTTVADSVPIIAEGYTALEGLIGDSFELIFISKPSFDSEKGIMDSQLYTPLSPVNAESWHFPQRNVSNKPNFVVPPHMIVAPAQKLEGWRLIVVEIWYFSFPKNDGDIC